MKKQGVIHIHEMRKEEEKDAHGVNKHDCKAKGEDV